ncbi:hypothetical protein [uncultured Rikenella sp.]|uniref:hypothetical protein n=1 Tax=uncultured Rikenella sp. TaxID=368003 RepID=UPI0026297031|nr:hypothetical protein [uncultured Rikenella sp.]
MKRLILLLLSIFAITAVQAQQNVTLAECGGDTVLYLRKTFDDRKAEFIGQPFSKVLDEWESQLPVGFLVFGNTGMWPAKEEDKYLVQSVSIYYNTEIETNLKGMRHEPYYGVKISFIPPYLHKVREFWRLQEEEELQLGPQLYEKLKDYIVKDIYMFELRQ